MVEKVPVGYLKISPVSIVSEYKKILKRRRKKILKNTQIKTGPIRDGNPNEGIILFGLIPKIFIL